MYELIVPLKWEFIEQMLDHIDRHLTEQGFPTVLRVRTGMLAEELISALIAVNSDGTGLIRCTFPKLQEVRLQYRGNAGALNADFTMLRLLMNSPSVYGVATQLTNESCTFTVGVK